MSRPIAAITNGETGETTYEEMNDIDYSIYLADIEADKIAKAAAAEAEAKAATDKAAAQAKLAALGLTADDLKALGL
jgi:hypothetical protein